MVKTHEWLPTSRGKALGLRALGKVPLQEITNITSIPKSTVQDINTRGTGINKPRSSRPRKLSSQDIRHIIRYIWTDRHTRRITLNSLKKVFSLNIHENTLRSALKEAGIQHRIARRRSFLNNHNKQQRLKFAREHKNWKVEDWARVIFTDEMAVKLFMQRHIKDYIWRSEEEFHHDCINYAKQPTGVGLMFWGAFRKGKMGPGGFFNIKDGESINSVIYRD